MIVSKQVNQALNIDIEHPWCTMSIDEILYSYIKQWGELCINVCILISVCQETLRLLPNEVSFTVITFQENPYNTHKCSHICLFFIIDLDD